MNVSATHKIEGFRGINNVHDPNVLQVSREDGSLFLTKADNVDITDGRRASRRSGSESVYAGSYPVHSLYATESGVLFVENASLKLIDETYSTSTLTSGLSPNLRMNYVDIGGSIYYTNGYNKGYIVNNVVNSFVVPVDEFKVQMPAGHLIEYYNGRLYIAVGNVVYVSDAYHIMQYDQRNGMMLFENRVTVMKATKNCLWIGTTDNVICLLGGSIADFTYQTKADYGAVENSGVKTSATNVGLEIDGEVVVFATPRGICIGAPEGLFRNMTDDYYRFNLDVQNSSAVIDVQEDKHQYKLFTEVYTAGTSGRIATDFPFFETSAEDNPMLIPLLSVSFTGTFQ